MRQIGWTAVFEKHGAFQGPNPGLTWYGAYGEDRTISQFGDQMGTIIPDM